MKCTTAHIHTRILLSFGSANPQEMKGDSHCSLIPVSCCGGSFGAWRREAGPVDAPTHGVLDRSTDVTLAKPHADPESYLLEIDVRLTPLSFKLSLGCGEKRGAERQREREAERERERDRDREREAETERERQKQRERAEEPFHRPESWCFLMGSQALMLD